jgi:flagella basal body P-ring formation protein FlgA
MQMLCPNHHPHRSLLPLLKVLWLALLGLFASMSLAGTNELTSQVQRWAASQYGVSAQHIRVAPPDERINIQMCAPGWQFDQPFANDTTVRARCTQPNRQVFLRLEVSGHSTSAQASRADTIIESQPVATRTVVVTNTVLPRGTRLQPEHLTLQTMPSQGLHNMALEQIEDAMDAELVRNLPSGSVLRLQDLRPALMVRKGHWVHLHWEPVQGFQIAVRLEALQDGRMGETIRLINRESGKVINALVTGANTAQAL